MCRGEVWQTRYKLEGFVPRKLKLKLIGEARVSIQAAPVEDNACILGKFGKEGTQETKKLTIIPRGY